jgi:hypothetical protein
MKYFGIALAVLGGSYHVLSVEYHVVLAIGAIVAGIYIFITSK